MSLMDALLLDPFALDVWIAPRTDGVSGTATESDPLDGSTQAKFDGAMLALPIAVSSITRSSTTATVLAINNGYSNGDLVLIVGATGLDGGLYNGIFSIFNVNIGANTFQYTMSGTPGAAATGVISCRLAVAAGAVVPLPVIPPVAVHLGPGTLQTQGFAPGLSQTQWRPGAALKVFGSGMGVTILQVVGASLDYEYVAIGSNYNDYLDSFEASDFTVDCNLAGQMSSTLACAAIQVVGKHTRTRRIRVINYGTQTPGFECFPLTIGGAHPDLSDAGEECFDDVIEDCILEQPSLNNARETTCTNIGGGERPTDGVTAYHRACVVRRCFINGEYRQDPVSISSITVGAGGVATVTTRLPHGRVTNDWVRISGALLSGNTNNSLNGCYQITYVNDYSFTYVTNPAQGSGVTPSGDMWVGRFSSQVIQITSASWNSGTATITTDTPHFLAPGSTVVISEMPVSGYNGVFQVSAVIAFNQFEFSLSPYPGGSSSGGFIGVGFQALSADAGTAAVAEGNRVCNLRTGGPYHDTYNSRDLIVRNNYYRGVVAGPAESLGGLSRSTTLIPLSITNAGTTAIATTSIAHGFSANDQVLIAGANYPQYNSPAGQYWTILSSGLTLTQFEYVMNGVPAGPATGAGYATADAAKLLQSLTYALTNGLYVAKATIDTSLFPEHGFSVGDVVHITKVDFQGTQPYQPYTGYFVVSALGAHPDEQTIFYFNLPANPNPPNTSGSSPSGYYARLWQTQRIVVENNVVELVPTPTSFGPPFAVLMQGGANNQPLLYDEAVVRRNVIRHIDGLSDSGRPGDGTGIAVDSCSDLLVEENVMDLDSSTPVEFEYCGNTEFFANQSSGGVLIQGFNSATNMAVNELSNTLEDAEALALC
ncbi:MAG TPA: hypothetical protein VG146_09240 [Verrucomicrobiae bacterium]|nr:hypothetical protein [Verrucomicrobiae bacterium]